MSLAHAAPNAHPDRVLIVIVGNAKDIRGPLGSLGVAVQEMAIDGNTLAIA